MSKQQSAIFEGTMNQISNVRGQQVVEQPPNGQAEIGAHTATAAKPTPMDPNEKNPEDLPQPQKDIKQPARNYKKIAILASIIALLILIGSILGIVLLATRPRLQTVVVNNYVSVPMASGERVKTQVVQVKDPEILKSQNPVEVYVSQIEQPKSKSNTGRLLQQSKALTSYSIYDKKLGCGVTVMSLSLQLSLVIDVSKILSFIFNSQPQTQPKEETLTKDQKGSMKESEFETIVYNYPLIGDKITRNVKSRLQKLNQKALAFETTNINIKYNKQIKAFETVPQVQSQDTESAILFQPSKVKVIKDFKNEDEMTEAGTQIVYGALLKAKQFFEKRSGELKEKTGVNLATNVQDFAQTSIYLNAASDFEKECITVGNEILQCDTKMLSSDGINLQLKQKQEQPTTNIKVFVDL